MNRFDTKTNGAACFLADLKTRQESVDGEVLRTVSEILEDVRKEGDKALSRYSERFDGITGPPRFLDMQDARAAIKRIPADLLTAMEASAENIRSFHAHQLPKGFEIKQPDGSVLGQVVRPLDRVGLYVPGGRAAYPSSVLMNAIPAKIAGVGELIMTTPPGPDGRVADVILAAAAISGVDRILLAGGAQACAALAYGTETVPQVDKITGPGNIYVATAKKLLYGIVDIDMIAGPSEILVIADDSANPCWVAADLLSQCEHDPLAAAILITPSARLADAVAAEIEKQSQELSRRDIVAASLKNTSAIIVTQDLDEAFHLANQVAPEHLELIIEGAEKALAQVQHAGSVFLGAHTPEAVGDYFAGTNHVLPTSGTARFFSPLGVESFLRRMQYVNYAPESIQVHGDAIATFALAEGLDAHAASVKVRMEDENK